MRNPHKNTSAEPELTLTGRGLMWVWADGKTLPVIRGGAEPLPVTDPPAPAPAPEPVTDPVTDPPDPARTFTQAEVNAIAKREADKAKRAATAALAEDLGVTIEEAKAMVAERNAAQDAAKTEAERARDAALASETTAKQNEAKASAALRDAQVLLGLARAGGVATPADADAETAAKAQADVAALVARELTELTEPLTAEHVDAAVKAVRDRFPTMFGAATSAPAPAGLPSTSTTGQPGGRPAPAANATEASTRGAQRAAAMGLAKPQPVPAGATS